MEKIIELLTIRKNNKKKVKVKEKKLLIIQNCKKMKQPCGKYTHTHTQREKEAHVEDKDSFCIYSIIAFFQLFSVCTDVMLLSTTKKSHLLVVLFLFTVSHIFITWLSKLIHGSHHDQQISPIPLVKLVKLISQCSTHNSKCYVLPRVCNRSDQKKTRETTKERKKLKKMLERWSDRVAETE